MVKKLLVTGGAGFIGSNFVKYWLDKHADSEVVVLDALTYAGNLSSLEQHLKYANFKFIQGDIRDSELVIKLLSDNSIYTIVNFAAESHVDRSISGAQPFIDTNIQGTFNLLEAAKKVWLSAQADECVPHRFHHVSTDEVYGTLTPEQSAFKESNQYLPNSPYSASKAASDHLVRAYHHTYGLNVTTSNCSNNYGSYHHPEKLIPLVITRILKNKAIPIYGDGRQIRDWLFVNDHCAAIDSILTSGQSGGVYNVGGNCEVSNLDLVHMICELVEDEFCHDAKLAQVYPNAHFAIEGKCKELITFVKDRPGHDRRYAVDINKISSELGFQPTVTLSEGLSSTIKWYLGNQSWWAKLL